MLLNQHHIATDGLSHGVLRQELGRAYDALLRPACSVTSAAPAVQYAEYAVWQRRWYGSGERLEQQLDWWRSTLGANPPVLELQPDFGRPAVLDTGCGGSVPVVLP